MRVICSWCRKELEAAGDGASLCLGEQETLSHGICDGCAERVLAEATGYRTVAVDPGVEWLDPPVVHDPWTDLGGEG